MHSAESLRQLASEHLRYEIEMLAVTADLLDDIPAGASTFDRNVWLESFCMHARVLTDFLTNRGRLPDDVNASDYAADWTADLDLHALAQTVNGQVAHMSIRRLAKAPIFAGPIASHLIESFDEFVARVPEPRRNWFAWFDPDHFAYPQGS